MTTPRRPGRSVGTRVNESVRQAGCIAFHGDGVVVRRTSSGHWVFPKGHLEPGETEAAAAVREMVEETGLEVEIVGPVGEVEFRQAGEDRLVLYFLARVRRELPSWADHLGRDTFIIPPERVRSTLSFENSRRLWDKAYGVEKEQQE